METLGRASSFVADDLLKPTLFSATVRQSGNQGYAAACEGAAFGWKPIHSKIAAKRPSPAG